MTNPTERADLTSMAAGVGDTTGFDRLMELLLDGINVVPVAGPIVAAVTKQILPRDSLIYLGNFAAEAARRVEALETGKLDRTYLSSDEFREDLEQVLDAQTLLIQRRKRSYYLAAVKNAAATDRPGDAERRRMLDALIRLRPSHLRLLAAVMTPEAYRGSAGNAEFYLSERLPGVPRDVVRLDWADLQGEGMLDTYPAGMAVTPPPQLVRGMLKPYGERFVRFVEADADSG